MSKVQIAEDERTAEQFSSYKVLDILFCNDFYLSVGCSSDKECSEGPSYLGNDELHPQDQNALDRAVTSTEEAGRGSSDECEDMMK